MTSELLIQAKTFLRDDPDPVTQAELSSLIARAEGGERDALGELEDRFSGPLEFGTAGLRGVLGAGENRMNRAVVRRATYGLVRHILRVIPDAARRGLVVGRDGRRLSRELQRDAAEVALALGVRVHFIESLAPTPVTAFGVKALGAAAGVMITASHNPPDYNGYKVYLDNGAQIIPPHDLEIAAEIAAAPPARDVPLLSLEAGRASGLLVDASALLSRYVEATKALTLVPHAPVDRLVIAYTALHGVGEATLRAAMAARGVAHLHSVQEQAEPDGAFPTVEFPNPEEAGALDRVHALSCKVGAHLVLANDPDADRLAVSVPRPNGAHVVLNGNEIGALLGHHVITRGADQGPERLVIATIVSSQLLRRIAAREGVCYAETLTGFKWIANEAMRLERESGARFVFGYEEALGYTLGSLVRDKDGIGAALAMVELAAILHAEGKTLLDELESIHRRYGLLLSRQKSITLPGREGRERIRAATEALRGSFVRELGGERVASVWDLASKRRTHADGTVEEVERFFSDVLVLDFEGGGRVSVRPSGTEPKLKLYLEVAETVDEGEPIASAESRGKVRLERLLAATLARIGL